MIWFLELAVCLAVIAIVGDMAICWTARAWRFVTALDAEIGNGVEESRCVDVEFTP